MRGLVVAAARFGRQDPPSWWRGASCLASGGSAATARPPRFPHRTQAYTTREVIALCERLGDADAEVRNVPVWLLKGTRAVLRSMQWAGDAADRLAFAEVLSSAENFSAPMEETWALLGIEPGSVTTLEAYMQVRAAAG